MNCFESRSLIIYSHERNIITALFHAGISQNEVLEEALLFQFVCSVFDPGQACGFYSSL